MSVCFLQPCWLLSSRCPAFITGAGEPRAGCQHACFHPTKYAPAPSLPRASGTQTQSPPHSTVLAMGQGFTSMARGHVRLGIGTCSLFPTERADVVLRPMRFDQQTARLTAPVGVAFEEATCFPPELKPWGWMDWGAKGLLITISSEPDMWGDI